jgi:hypothetical protein
MFSLLNFSSRKFAILISFEYKNSDIIKLNSSENDINNMFNLLIKYLNYKKENIYILKNKNKIDIIEFFKQFIHKIKSNDTLFLYITGHGYINAILTEDLNKLYDYEIAYNLIIKLNKNIKVFLLIDSCHSENLLNLQYCFIDNNWCIYNNKYLKIKCSVIIISSCMKNQLSYYINNESAMTKLFIKIIIENKNISWYDLINKLFDININQIPILSSNNIFDINKNIYFTN